MFGTILILSLLSLDARAITISFNYWPYEQEGCNNIRDQFLQQNSIRSQNVETSIIPATTDCHVKTGNWRDFFTDETIENPQDAIVTPIIPLDFLKPYGNFISFQRLFSYVHDQSLLIIIKKGGAGEKMYLANKKTLTTFPSRPNARCEMIGQWMDAKARWNFPMSTDEKTKLVKEAALCQTGDEYNRTETFGGWTTLSGFSCNTRVEVLKRDSKISTQPEAGETRPCTPRLIGKWLDPYTGQTFTDAHDMDIDHLVPLKHAYISGAWKWPNYKKRDFANDMSNKEHLITVDASVNRSKGDSSPELWMPPNLKFHCTYLSRWISIKLRWGLSMALAEKTFIKEQIAHCPNQDIKKQLEIIELLSLAAQD